MAFFRPGDIDLILADLAREGDAVDVTIGATTAKGVMDLSDESLLSDGASDFQGQSTMVSVKTGVFSALVVGVTVVADGVSYRAMRIRQNPDRAITHIDIARR